MSWFDLLKNIQISSQKTSSRDYVLPDDECKEWWLKLEDLLNALADKLHPENGPNTFDFQFIKRKTNEELCIMRDDVTEKWNMAYSMKIRNRLNPIKTTISLDAARLWDKDYECKMAFFIYNNEGGYFYYKFFLWGDMQKYPDDYRKEIDAIEKHLKIGGLLLSFMDGVSKYSIKVAGK